MMEAVLVASITGILTFLGSVYATKKSYNEHYQSIIDEFKTEIALLKVEMSNIRKDISNLEKKQDKHNSIVERMYIAEKSIELLEARQENIDEKVEELKKGR